MSLPKSDAEVLSIMAIGAMAGWMWRGIVHDFAATFREKYAAWKQRRYERDTAAFYRWITTHRDPPPDVDEDGFYPGEHPTDCWEGVTR